jgi:hypothetical protein
MYGLWPGSVQRSDSVRGFAELPGVTAADLLKLDKPFRQEELARAIAAVLRRQQESQARQRTH